MLIAYTCKILKKFWRQRVYINCLKLLLNNFLITFYGNLWIDMKCLFGFFLGYLSSFRWCLCKITSMDRSWTISTSSLRCSTRSHWSTHILWYNVSQKRKSNDYSHTNIFPNQKILLFQNSRVTEAEYWFKRALKLAPTDASVHHHYGKWIFSV